MASSCSGSSNSAIRYIYQLPYSVFYQVCRLLDLDARWRDIGGNHFDVMTLEEFRRAVYRGESPSQAMLTRWGQKNGTINKLFIELYNIQYLRVMEIIKPYVSSKYHHLLDGNNTTEFFDTNPSSFNRNSSRSKMISSRPVEASHYGGIPCNSMRIPVPSPSTYSGYHYMSHDQSYRKAAFNQGKEPVETNFYQNHHIHSHSNPYMSHEQSYKKASLNYEKEPVEANIPSDCVLGFPGKDSSYSSSKLHGEFDTSSRHGKTSMSSKPSLNYLKEQNSKQACCMGNHQDSKSSLEIRTDQPPSYHSKSNFKNNLPPYPSKGSSHDSFPPPYSHKGSPKESLLPKKQSNENHIVKDAPPRRKISPADAPQSFPSFSVILQVSYKELQEATNDFHSLILGKGGFGVVYKGKWRNTDVAIKKIGKEENHGSTNIEEAKLQQSLVELKTLESIRHDNILNLYGYCLNDNTLCLIYQLMDSSLEDRLLMRDRSKPPLTWFDRCKIARGASCGIQFLHSYSERPLIHGDIKSANILLDKNLEPKIGDFGLVREGPHNEKTHTYVNHVNGTHQYLPHEYLREHKLSTKVDTYSFGVVLFELATGKRAFDPNQSSGKRYLIHYFHGSNKEKIDHLCDRNGGEKFQHLFQTFVHQGQICTSPDKADRPEMSQVYQIFESSLLVLEVVMKSNKETLMQKLYRPETSPLERQIINQMIHYQPTYNRQGPQRQVPTRERLPAHAYEDRQPPPVRLPPPPPQPQYQKKRIPVQQTEVNPAASYEYQENGRIQALEVGSSNEKPPSYAEVIHEYQTPSFAPPPQSSYCPPSANPLPDYGKQNKEVVDLSLLPNLTALGFKHEQVPEPTNNQVSSPSDSQMTKHPESCSAVPEYATPCVPESSEDSEGCIIMKPPLSSKGKSLIFLSDVDQGEPVTEKSPVKDYEFQQPPSIRPLGYQDQENVSPTVQSLEVKLPNAKVPSYAEALNEYEVPSFAPPPLSSYCPPSTNPLSDYTGKQGEETESPDLSYLPNLTEFGFNNEQSPILPKNGVSNTSNLHMMKHPQSSSAVPEHGSPCVSEPSVDSKECISMDPPLSSKGKSLILSSDEDEVNNCALPELMKKVHI